MGGEEVREVPNIPEGLWLEKFLRPWKERSTGSHLGKDPVTSNQGCGSGSTLKKVAGSGSELGSI